jgi:MFS family permease
MEQNPDKPAKLIRIFELVANDSAAVFPYLFAFYLISLFVSIFSAVWRGFFYWPAFNAGVILFALLSLGSDKASALWKEITEISKRGREKGGAVAGRGSLTLRKLLESILVIVFIPLWKKVVFWKKNLGISGYLKLAAMLILLAFSLFRGIYIYDFFILLFGLVSVLFTLDSRISAAFALALLIACPFLLIFNENIFAEQAAVYAYYFLVIAVMTQIGEYLGKAQGSAPGPL